MAFTFTPASDLGRVRLLIADTRVEGHLMEDEELQALLDFNTGSVRLAAADALDSIATHLTIQLGATRLLDIQVDGTKQAAELRKRAASLRHDVLVGEDTVVASAIAEYPSGIFGETEYLLNRLVQ